MNIKCTAVIGCLSAALFCFSAQAGVVINGTRVIYKSDEQEITVKLTNMGKQPVLVQSWLDNGDDKVKPDKITTPFTLTPPINRVEAGKGQSLRISAVNTGALSQDRESLWWLNVLEIPARPTTTADNQNRLQVAVRSRIKFFYRPAALKGEANRAIQALTWTQNAAALTVKNPTPYYVSLTNIVANGKTIPVDMVGPMNSQTIKATFSKGTQIQVGWVDDFGAHRKQSFTVN